MPHKATINFPPANPVPPVGYRFGFRPQGSTADFAYFTAAPNINTFHLPNLVEKSVYEYVLQSIGNNNTYSPGRRGTFCTCPDNFVKDDYNQCTWVINIGATVTRSNYCLAPSTNENYSQFYTRIYNKNPNLNSISTNTPAPEDVRTVLYTLGLWKASGTWPWDGPMNDSAIWIDSDCDGVKNALNSSELATVSYAYNNPGPPFDVFIGVGADNYFQLKVNEDIMAETLIFGRDANFKVWHIFQITFRHGFNVVNLMGKGDGSTNDATAMKIYKNTYDELITATSVSQLNILFDTKDLIGKHIDVAFCPGDYSLDTSGGVGNYKCRKTIDADCGAGVAVLT